MLSNRTTTSMKNQSWNSSMCARRSSMATNRYWRITRISQIHSRWRRIILRWCSINKRPGLKISSLKSLGVRWLIWTYLWLGKQKTQRSRMEVLIIARQALRALDSRSRSIRKNSKINGKTRKISVQRKLISKKRNPSFRNRKQMQKYRRRRMFSQKSTAMISR